DRDRAAVERLAALDGAHREPGEVVIALRIHARHLRRLAPDQRAADLAASARDAGNDGAARRHIELAGGEIVEEEQRLGALHDEIVDAHGDEVGADGVVATGGYGNFELGADAVGGGDQDWILVACRLQVEEGTETAEPGFGAGP